MPGIQYTVEVSNLDRVVDHGALDHGVVDHWGIDHPEAAVRSSR